MKSFRQFSLRQVLPLVTACLLMLLLADVAAACPTCKDAVDVNDPQHQSIARGYFYSILFMLGMPFLLIGGFCLHMYREVQKARRVAAKPQAAAQM